MGTKWNKLVVLPHDNFQLIFNSGSSDRAILIWDGQNLSDFEEHLSEDNTVEPDRITVDAWSSSSEDES